MTRATRADGGELPDDHSIRCYDCERVVHRRHVDFVEVPVDNEDGIGYDMVPVPLCKDCRLRRYGVECQHCGDYHWDIEGVVECERDRPSMLPDGGTESADRNRGPHGEVRLRLDELDDDYQFVEQDLKAKVWEADNGDRLLFLRVRDSHDGRRFNEFAVEIPDSRDADAERGRAPDARDIDDLVAIDVCPHCRAEPAVVIVTRGDDECYHCGGAIR